MARLTLTTLLCLALGGCYSPPAKTVLAVGDEGIRVAVPLINCQTGNDDLSMTGWFDAKLEVTNPNERPIQLDTKRVSITINGDRYSPWTRHRVLAIAPRSTRTWFLHLNGNSIRCNHDLLLVFDDAFTDANRPLRVSALSIRPSDPDPPPPIVPW